MAFDDAIRALSVDALGHVRDYSIIGLGSGRAATALAKALARLIEAKDLHVVAIPTSLQIKLEAEKGGIPIVEADQVDHIDAVFDGADQIDAQGYVIKGGGGALLRENVLFSMAKKVIVMADSTKFSKNLTRDVPVEVHPVARTAAAIGISKLGGTAKVRTAARNYPFFTENGNIILDCGFGTIRNPKQLAQRIRQVPGVLECGIFQRRPDVTYRAKAGGKFDVL